MQKLGLIDHLNALNRMKISRLSLEIANPKSDRIQTLNTVIGVYERLYKKDTVEIYDFTPIETK